VRQEELVQEFFITGKKSKSYEKVYDTKTKSRKSLAVKSSDELSKPHLLRRLAELTSRVELNNMITHDEHLTELARLRDLAVDKDQMGPAIAAEHNRGKVSGLYVEKVQSIVSIHENLTEAELDRKLLELENKAKTD